jgi:hypothetical protein
VGRLVVECVSASTAFVTDNAVSTVRGFKPRLATLEPGEGRNGGVVPILRSRENHAGTLTTPNLPLIDHRYPEVGDRKVAIAGAERKILIPIS